MTITEQITNLDFDTKIWIADHQILRFSSKKVYVFTADGMHHSIMDNDIAVAFLTKCLVA